MEQYIADFKDMNTSPFFSRTFTLNLSLIRLKMIKHFKLNKKISKRKFKLTLVCRKRINKYYLICIIVNTDLYYGILSVTSVVTVNITNSPR